MRILFAVGIFLTCAQTSSGYNNSQKLFLVGLKNKYRYDMAKNNHFANMHEVRWNNDLQQVVEDMACEKIDEKRLSSVKETNVSLLEMMNLAEEHPLLTCEIPTQTQIACARRYCQNGYSDPCICGPKVKFDKSDFIQGEPGTMCPGENMNGLCVRVPTTTTRTTIRRKTIREGSEYDYEEDSSTNGFIIGVILNLISFLLVVIL
ncbi:hypothetical protein B9Z55_012084 [Caenorhabditis nigoni]|uniref:Uncharacterized protein n=1 Tax=Caenorhabditis nigoni TaxID=1611254 RepID=A0A2G5TVN5_9PELO|nr:hypothetical protein B9Z55_012084 [Caenorhabditis nigoni]